MSHGGHPWSAPAWHRRIRRAARLLFRHDPADIREDERAEQLLREARSKAKTSPMQEAHWKGGGCHQDFQDLEKNWRVPTDIWSWTFNNLQILGILAAFCGFELVEKEQREVHLQVSRGSEPTSERCSNYGQSAKMADSTAMFWIFLDHICGSMNKNVYFASKMIWAFSII